MINNNRMRLGDLLVSVGKLTNEQLKKALDQQKNTGKKLGELLVDLGYITEMDMIQVLEFQLGIPHVDLDKFFIDPQAPKMISENIAKRNMLIPIKIEKGVLTVAMADPLNIFAMDDVRIATGLEVKPVISTRKDILNAITQYYEKENAKKALEEFKEAYHIDIPEELDEETLNQINNAPVVKLVNSIIKQAIKMQASDIHIEPFDKIIRVRLRVDGELQEIMTPSKASHSAIVTRIKIMGKMNIAEKRIPQDGRVETVVDGKEVDLRISILPTVFGEKIVIRLLDRSSFMVSKKDLGFTDYNLQLFNNIIKNPNGIILVTGPTGSGKSTTLYSALSELNQPNKNIITVEDPVEYQLEGVNQVQVNTKAGLTFALGLRSILRQDPDIIMIGEIRDAETAQIAVRAAITGHLVLSTMHTNDTASTVARLVDMGIEPYLVSSSLVGVVAQRLVKRICENCKISYQPDMAEVKTLGIESNAILYRGKGCNACNSTGYKGRIAVHEIMPVSKGIRTLIDSQGTIDNLRAKAVAEGMSSLRDNCIMLALQGITTTEEVLKIAYSLE